MVTLVPTYRMILADLPQFYQNYYNGFGLGQILGFPCLLSPNFSVNSICYLLLKIKFHPGPRPGALWAGGDGGLQTPPCRALIQFLKWNKISPHL